MTDLHRNYDQLTGSERDALDGALRRLFQQMQDSGHALVGDDRAERAADALAVCIIAARR